MTFEQKRIGDVSILFVMAADAEYGPRLAARFKPLMTGVGPVEAAVVLAKTLAELAVADNLPDLLVSLGSAGSAKLLQSEVYQVTAVSYRDMDASPLGFTKGETPFLGLPAVLKLPHRIPGVAPASLSTGANIVSGAAYDGIDADMVDMETYAVLRAAQAFGIDVIGLRGISDGKADLKHIGDWTEYLHIIDQNLADAVDRLYLGLESGEIRL
ncbi:5'-methylthioadenosine/S-adenosylhomocysteine nucleosidase [Rhizobiaceae bacterium n13]|uniref:5'-methylthioadenosine/S-adenosylhomocysteine nucleosidase n=1 Tax=Ferirhizobium litorale TaxID=2927786 RepID=A0AAE3U6A7_9HYPH|nr:5'-methylthioadenosine/S-adenosylhomocysteine nucleosidase [Fererhizobium litorale]MDI7864560.1 5'-methylthioadenosine/S-adenosylhomocysteine nucleosidase [Fererhizobium litorale]MDI7924899.1 5'-methylthioadenosine/S-adenosylhomocysteine nucleosidase [Fererhizobium litorale]